MRRIPGLLSVALATVAPVLAPLLLAGCETTPEEPDPVLMEAEVVAGSDRLLWDVILLSMRKLNYPESAASQPTEMHAISGWKMELSPFKGEGWRKRAEVTCTPVGPGRWRVETRVAMQVNETLAKTLDPSYAEWEWAADDTGEARVLLFHIRTFLDPQIELSPEEEDPIRRFLDREEAR